MPREIKILLFALISLIGIASFVGGWVETGSAFGGLILLLQIAGIAVGSIVGLIFFLWIGSKIFK